MDGLVFVGKPSRAFKLFPADLWFEVIDYLSVLDIVRLRAVSRNFYRIISSPVVWKRLLRKISIPLPHQHLPIRTLSAKATESVIRRAVLLELNWQRMNPHATSRVLSSNERPYLVRILSGGRYLVAATRSCEDSSFAVCVWDLENPEQLGGGCALLAKCRTRTAVSQLVVKYFTFQGNPGIAIATLRSIGEKPATKTEVCVLHISFAALDKLSKDEDLGEQLPFQLVELHKTRCQIAYMNLEGDILSVVHRPRTLMLFQLGTKKQAQLKLQNPRDGQRHSIQGCKIIPFQKQVLVIRLIYAEDHTSYAFEIYELPDWDSIVKEPPPLQHQIFEEVAASSFSISDIVLRQPNTDHPTELDNFRHCQYAAPISIFANTLRPKGIIHWQLTPRLLPASSAATFGMGGIPQPGNVVPGLIGHNPAFPQPIQPATEPPPTTLNPAAGQIPLMPHPGLMMQALPAGFPPIPPQMQAAALAQGLFGPLLMPTPPQMTGPFPPPQGIPPVATPAPPTLPVAPDLDLPMSDVSDVPLVPHYSLPALRLSHYWFEENDQKPAVSAGADRSVFWTRPLETRADYPPMRNLLGYSSKAPTMNPNATWTSVLLSVLSTLGTEDENDRWGLLPPGSSPTGMGGTHPGTNPAGHVHTNGNPIPDGNANANGDGNFNGTGNANGNAGDPPTNGPDDRRLKQLSLPAEFVEAVQQGTQNVSFDETSGKLCIVAGKPTKLYLLDYGW